MDAYKDLIGLDKTVKKKYFTGGVKLHKLICTNKNNLYINTMSGKIFMKYSMERVGFQQCGLI